MRNLFLVAAALLMSTTVFASGTTTIDGDILKSADRTKTWTMPAATDTILGRATTDTLTNKSMSGASNTFTAIPASAISSGTLGVANGGTGAATLTLNGMLFGNGTSAVGITAAGSQYQIFQAGASGVPTVGPLQLAQSAAVTGSLPVANGGTGLATLTSGSVLIGAGTSSPTFVAPGSSGNVLSSNGSAWVSSAPASSSPSLNGGSASPQTVVAVTGVVLSSIGYGNFAWLNSLGAVTVTATPSVTACTADGQILRLIGTSNTNVVTLQDQASLPSSGLSLNGNWAGSKDRSLTLHCDITQGLWVEDDRR